MNQQLTKICKYCNKQFTPKRKDAIYCSHRCADRAYYRRDPEKRKQQYTAQYEKHKEKHKTRWRKQRYGLTDEQFNSLIILQNNKCTICDTELNPPHVDHCHRTKKVRSLLCKQCNSGLGSFCDNPEFLIKAAQYIIKNS